MKMTAAEAAREVFERAAEFDEVVDAEYAVEHADSMVFHHVEEVVPLRRYRVRVFVYGRMAADVWRRNYPDACASGIRISHRYARLAAVR